MTFPLPSVYLSSCPLNVFWPIYSALKTALKITQSSVQGLGGEKHMMKCQVMLKTSHVIEVEQRVLWVNRMGPSQKGPNGILKLHWVGMHNRVNNSSTHVQIKEGGI